MTVLHVNYGPGPVRELKREDEKVRWCFNCRKRLLHTAVLSAYDCDPLDDWYGPWWALRCAGCGGDHTAFPGWGSE